MSFEELIKALTVIWPHDFNLINPPTWYIGLEVRLFLLIPILIMLCNTKYTNWWLLIFIAFLFIATNRFLFALVYADVLLRLFIIDL